MDGCLTVVVPPLLEPLTRIEVAGRPAAAGRPVRVRPGDVLVLLAITAALPAGVVVAGVTATVTVGPGTAARITLPTLVLATSADEPLTSEVA